MVHLANESNDKQAGLNVTRDLTYFWRFFTLNLYLHANSLTLEKHFSESSILRDSRVLSLSLSHPLIVLVSPCGDRSKLMELHQPKRPVIVYRSVSIGTKLICEQQLIPIKPNKESANLEVDDSISNVVCITHKHTRIHTHTQTGRDLFGNVYVAFTHLLCTL